MRKELFALRNIFGIKRGLPHNAHPQYPKHQRRKRKPKITDYTAACIETLQNSGRL